MLAALRFCHGLQVTWQNLSEGRSVLQKNLTTLKQCCAWPTAVLLLLFRLSLQKQLLLLLLLLLLRRKPLCMCLRVYVHAVSAICVALCCRQWTQRLSQRPRKRPFEISWLPFRSVCLKGRKRPALPTSSVPPRQQWQTLTQRWPLGRSLGSSGWMWGLTPRPCWKPGMPFRSNMPSCQS